MTADNAGQTAFKDHFSGKSADYAVFRPHYPPELAAALADLAPARERALDVGCGNGQLSALLAEHFAAVVATDAGAQQVAAAAAHPKVRYRCAPAETSGLPDASVDLLTAAQAAHWFDLDAFYAEARRVLRPGGVLALVTYGVTEADGEVGAVIDRFYRDVLRGHWPAERRHVESGYRDLPFPFPELPPPALAMRSRRTQAETLGYIDTWSAVRSLERTADGRTAWDAFARDLTAAWGDPDERREIRWPLSMRLGRT